MNDSILLDEILKLSLQRDAGEATEESLARLERILSESREAVVLYVKTVEDGLTIRESTQARANVNLDSTASDFDEPADREDAGPNRKTSRSTSWPVSSFYLAAACVIFAALGLLMISSPRWLKSNAPIESQSIARVVNISDVEWEGDAKHFTPWTPVSVGDTLRFRNGVINLFISSGVELLIEGPANVRFASLERIVVEEGKLAARVGPDAIGLSIETPHANVIDRGTSFGISVDRTQQTDVVVYEGIVDLDVVGHGLKPRRRLTTGEALRVNNEGDLSRISSVQGEGFVAPPQARNGSARYTSVIESVQDNVRLVETTKFNRVIRDGFEEDCRAYVDREHEWNGVDESGLPASLVGGDYVMTFNQDKTATEFQLTVVLSQPANLYLLIDNRVPPPDWLVRDFVNTQLKVGLDEVHPHANLTAARGPGKSLDQVYSVWHREVPEASTVVLGPLGHEQFAKPARVVKRGMYGIVATPLDRDRKSNELQKPTTSI